MGISSSKVPPSAEEALRSAPINDSAVLRIRVDMRVKEDAEKMRKEIDRVNMIEVLLFLFLWPSMFLTMILYTRRSLLQQVFSVSQSRPDSTYWKTSTAMKVSPMIMRIKSILRSTKSKICIYLKKAIGIT